MAGLHAGAAFAVLAGALLLALTAALAAWRDVAHEMVRRLALGVVGLFGIEAAAGIGVAASGEMPGEGLHLLYGAALVAVIPVGMVFAGEAPPRARSVVLAVAALAALLMAWRLFATG